ncbi:MAG TPA: YqiA/YcfP family alpha/beta fold hydrolase [Thermoanaerobaculia bacterium]|nr:YqiA/YcfP family alpha/beta fold hydrolase [Thermoanaerobaculia bacterium]
MTSVLYFHGFASSPASAKITALRPLLEPHGIELNAPDLNVPSFEQLDFEAIVEHALECARRTPPRALVGSSLGALIAISVAKRGVAVPMVLIAPALGVARRWREKIPDGDPVTVFNFARNADAQIHRLFFEQMTNLHVDETPPPSRVTAIMGRNDETVPFHMVEERWREWEASGALVPGSQLIVIEEGDHGLVDQTHVIEQLIVEAAR